MDVSSFFMAIALLCQTTSSVNNLQNTRDFQVKCQREYVECLEKQSPTNIANTFATDFVKCIKIVK